jgi:hypothetical protein
MKEYNFTIYNDYKVNERIREDLSKIKTVILREFFDVEALILVGGFGRGEGGVIIVDDIVKPINDYDIVVVSEEKILPQKINKIRKKLAEEIGIWWVDISIFNKRKLQKLKTSIYSYDLKYGGIVFFGNPEILNLIPRMVASKIPLIDGEYLFITRLWTFLGPFSTEFLNRKLTKDESFFLANQMSKAILACVDVLLLSKGCYHVSYAERNKIVKNIFPDMVEYFVVFDWALETKLRPVLGEMYTVEAYFNIKNFYFKIMKRFLSKLYKREFSDWAIFFKAYKNKFHSMLRRIGYIVLKRSFRYERKLNIDLAQLSLLISWNRDSVEKKYFFQALQYLKKATGKDYDEFSLEDARKLIVELRNTI